ncbi:MAG: peptide/nickel transport system ATP-binding protein [Candidatus Thermoplasmatota archaeon]|nr:peptide/nickel transport system ATP-binding protein [Candidatus Thermoplasmatota archaeon]
MVKDILVVKDLQVWFPMRTGFIQSLVSKEQRWVKAVDGVSFNIKDREIFCLVGESGCGKTTTGKAILRLVEPTGGKVKYYGEGKNTLMKEMLEDAVSKGKVTKEQAAKMMAEGGLDVRALQKGRMKRLRQKMQIIFQDPYESLNPKQSIYDIIAEPLVVNGIGANEAEREKRVVKALDDAGLRPPKDFMWRYPHEVSGGQRQRVGIAGALVLQPEFLVADEPVSMLDVSIRSEILKLMLDLREQKGLAFLFITHDLGVAYVFSDRIGIMYLGKIVELGPTEEVVKQPKHPYTKALISVVPTPDPEMRRDKIILKGERPDPANIPPGCRFHPRCPFVMDICRKEAPKAVFVSEGHWVSCHLETGTPAEPPPEEKKA